MNENMAQKNLVRAAGACCVIGRYAHRHGEGTFVRFPDGRCWYRPDNLPDPAQAGQDVLQIVRDTTTPKEPTDR